MFSIFKKKESPILIVKVNGVEVCTVTSSDLPCEKSPSVYVEQNEVIEFFDASGEIHTHELGLISGWCHLSIRVHSNLACQTDCVITNAPKFDPSVFSKGDAVGIRFQPFFLSGAKFKGEGLKGKGLFARGLHFGGTVSDGKIVLSCECDCCKRSFQIRSYHAGFSNSGYFYSGSGRYTITVDDHIPGSPGALLEPNAEALAELEASLPLAPDGTAFKYSNPFCCPHCSAPYIDFESFPEDRPGEYYGNYFVGSELLRYEPVCG